MALTIKEILTMVSVGGKTKTITMDPIPGIGTGSAYTAADAFGTKFKLPGVSRLPGLGWAVASALLLDRDDEGLETEIVLFNADFTATADNAAFDVSDGDLAKVVGTINISTFRNWASNQLGIATTVGLYGNTMESSTDLWAQCVARGAPNIAAANLPGLVLVFAQD